MKEFELRGVWWLPASPQNRPFGILRFRPSTGGELEVFGGLGNRKDPFDADAQYDIVLGLTSSGEPVTLRGCYQFATEIRPQTMDTTAEKYQVHRTFTGYHFPTPSSLRFKSLSVRFHNLEEWANTSGIQMRRIPPEASKQQVAFSRDYVQPASVRAEVSGADVTVHFLPGFSSGRHTDSITERVVMNIATREPLLFDEFMRRFVYNLQGFLCLGMGAPTSVTALAGEPVRDAGPVPGSQGLPENVKVAWKVHGPEGGENRDVSFFEMLFTLREMGEEFAQCLSNWFSKTDELQPVYDLYAGVVHSRSMYPHLQFLSYAQALETYHRRSSGGAYMSNDDYAPVRDALSGAIPRSLAQDFRESLENKLQYLNQYSLRKRLRELFSTFLPLIGVPVSECLSLVPDIVDLRNCLTHGDKDPSFGAESQRVYDLSGLMKLVVETALLTEIGLSKEKVRRAVKLDSRYALMLERLLKQG